MWGDEVKSVRHQMISNGFRSFPAIHFFGLGEILRTSAHLKYLRWPFFRSGGSKKTALICVTFISRSPCTTRAYTEYSRGHDTRRARDLVLAPTESLSGPPLTSQPFAWLWALSQMQASCRTHFWALPGLGLLALGTSPNRKSILHSPEPSMPIF